MTRYIPLIFLCSSLIVLAQKEYVEVNNPVYQFLERLEVQHIIADYDEFEIPKTRQIIADKLKEISSSKDILNSADRLQYEDLLIEFDLEVSDTTLNTTSVFEKDFNLFSDKSKYLYYKTGESGNLFISLLAETELVALNTYDDIEHNPAYLFQFGGQIRGTLLNKFGFSIKGTNGKAFGEEETALIKRELQYNFKYNEGGEYYFDKTEGYLTADFDLVRFKIGRDRMNIGPGSLKPIVYSYSPQFDFVSFNINYDIFTFSYFHGKILGDAVHENDSITGGSIKVTDKYLGYHRIGFNFSRHFTFGAGEMIVYGDRPLDFAYLNPFNFYKTAEHANGDRDNSLMFLDFTNNSIRHLKFYTLLLIDDIKFSKINTGWWGNQLLLNAGAGAYGIFNKPLDIRLEYLRIDPYTYTHRLSRNKYTNQGYPLGPSAEPNSETYLFGVNYWFTGRLQSGFEFTYYVHGANPFNSDGSVKNVGGDLLLGHRTTDSIDVNFLDGDLEYVRNYSFLLAYEPINQFIFSIRINYISESLQNELSQKKLESFVKLSIRL